MVDDWVARCTLTHSNTHKYKQVYHRSRLSREDRTPWFNIALARGDFVGAGSLMALQAYAQVRAARRMDFGLFFTSHS